MTNVQSWTMTGLATLALGAGVLLASGAVSFAQTDEPTPTPSATEAPDEGTSPTPSPSDEGDTQPEDQESQENRGCGPGGKYLIKEAAAEVLGMSEDELITALREGQTLAEIAEAQGMSVEDFRAALTENVTADLQAQLDAGEITQEEFDEITAGLDEKIDRIINAEGGLRFRRGPGGANEDGGLRFSPPFEAVDEEESDA
jgi:hypothetical protein